ncbi:putative zinc protease [subsurface metagenome]
MPKFYSFSLGFFINCGSRDEPPKDSGITHLIEHMLFKGTSQKSSLDIVKLIEGLGGSFDAYTTKENLIIITKFLSEHMIRVFNLIAELLLESKIAEKEMVKEKSVILEEIKSNNEDPGDYVFDLFFKSLFQNHSMGLPIAGTEESVKKIDAKKTKIHYRELLKKEIVVAVSGNFDSKEILKLTEKRFGHLDADPVKRTKPEGYCSKLVVQRRNEISQVHLVFGVPGVEYTSPWRYRFSILNTAFGGGMSSRLFQGLREKEGLVYNVQSFIDLYSDCGISGFYFVCDKNNLKRVAKQLKTIFSEIHKNGFSKDEIELAKTYLSGNLLLSLESSTNRMLRLGREMSYLKKTNSIDDIIKRIRTVNEKQINELITEYLNPKKYTIAAIGPISEKEVEDIFRSI